MPKRQIILAAPGTIAKFEVRNRVPGVGFDAAGEHFELPVVAWMLGAHCDQLVPMVLGDEGTALTVSDLMSERRRQLPEGSRILLVAVSLNAHDFPCNS